MPVDLAAGARDLLTQEVQLYKALRMMVSREQEAIVLNQDMDELLQIFKKKDGVISQLQLLSDAWQDLLAPVGISGPRGTEGFWERLLSLFPEDSELADLLEEARTASSDLMRAEDESIALLKKYAADLREQTSSLVKGRHVAATYNRMGGAYQ